MTRTHSVDDHDGQARREHHRAAPLPLLAAAQRAAASGWAVFPVRPCGKTPAVEDWENRATTDPDRITTWWSTAPWNVGLAAGPSGLIVIDLDIDHDAMTFGAKDGAAALRRLATDLGQDPPWDTLTVSTPSGGRHLYFRQPDDVELRNTQGTLGPKIDTRGHGGYVLAAGSRGPDHHRYRVLRDLPVTPLPEWLQLALTIPPPPTATTAAPVNGGRVDAHLPVVSAARTEAYLRAVVGGETRAVTAAQVGARHDTLLRAARRLGHWVGSGALTHADAYAELAAAASGYLGVFGYTARQVDRDITDGLAYGAARPRHIDDLPDRPDHRASGCHGPGDRG